MKAADLEDQLSLWQTYYNWYRPHTSLNGKTPLDRYSELMSITPFSGEVAEQYDAAKEPLRVREYALDRRLQRLLKLKQGR